MTTRKNRNKGRAGWILGAIFLALLVLLSTGKSGFISQIRIKLKKNKTLKLQEQIQEEIDTLKVEEKSLHDPQTIEKLARENYGMAKENEKVYHIEVEEKKNVE